MQSVLKKNQYSIHEDKLVFEKYCHGDITLQECKKIFIENNNVPFDKSVLITDKIFEDWLKSLGWWK